MLNFAWRRKRFIILATLLLVIASPVVLAEGEDSVGGIDRDRTGRSQKNRETSHDGFLHRVVRLGVSGWMPIRLRMKKLLHSRKNLSTSRLILKIQTILKMRKPESNTVSMDTRWLLFSMPRAS